MDTRKDFINELDMVLLDRRVQNRREINERELEDALEKRNEVQVMVDENPGNQKLGDLLDKLNKLLELDLMLLKAEASAGLMDGLPLPGGKVNE